MRVDSFLFSDKGGRECNEDRVDQKVFGQSCVFALADGLGGHMYGDLAAECVVRTLLQVQPDLDSADQWLFARISEANDRLLRLQAERGAPMRSTAAVLLLNAELAVWANVGDSRVYFLRDDELVSVTADHSVAYVKYRAGEIRREDIGSDIDQPTLLRVLGKAEHFEPDLARAPSSPRIGDGFLLCSDGVWEYLNDQEVQIDFLKAKDSRAWAELMLLRVMSRISGNHDNLSLITVMMKGDEDP